MKLSRRFTGISIVMVAILSISLISAGCIGSVDLFPGEVNNHGNTIYIDSDYVDSATLVQMLMYPNSYEQEFFETLEAYLPKYEPVIDIGVGTGAAMAYISDKLHLPKQHVAVEPNEYLIPSLKKTIEKNGLIIDLHQAAIAYNQDEPYVPFTVSKDLSQSIISPSETIETINVPVTTVKELIAGSTFSDTKNATLIVETSDLLRSIFTNEDTLVNHVDLIIANMPELKEAEEASLITLGFNLGYILKHVSKPSSKGVTTYVFKRVAMEDDSVEESVLNQTIVNKTLANQTHVAELIGNVSLYTPFFTSIPDTTNLKNR